MNAIVSIFASVFNHSHAFIDSSLDLPGSPPARDVRRDSGGRARDDFKGTNMAYRFVTFLNVFVDNRGRFVPRDSRVDEGRNRFESRRDNVDRDSREPHKWEHDLSTYRA